LPLHVADRARPHGGLVRTLTLSRPERRNALDPTHLELLREAVAAAEAEPLVRVVVVTGEGSAFCAGYDLAAPFPEGDATPDEIVVRTMEAVRRARMPVVARVNGPAFGAGFELAISADLRVASTAASFCLPPARLGIAYAPEGLGRLVGLVGIAASRRLAFTGDVVDARTARELGLVDELALEPELDAHVERLADRLADAAPMAVAAMKRTFNALETRLDEEERRVALEDRRACYASEDVAEGLAAFAEKRPARFRGR
jgi:enoyl-CoA hydratase/carnithine racemase